MRYPGGDSRYDMEDDALRITVTGGSKAAQDRTAVPAPPSKSMAHRHLICAALAEGESIIRNVAFSEDVLATIDCLRALGAEIEAVEDTGFTGVTGSRMALRICGTDPREPADTVLHCRESGSTLRFLIPLVIMSGCRIMMTGSGRLMERPLSVYEDLFGDRDIELIRSEEGLTVCGKLHGGEYIMKGSVSSQFVSGMLFALPLLRENSVIRLKPPVESRPYINMTMRALELSGVQAVWTEKGDAFFSVTAYDQLTGFTFADPVAAAYFEAKGHIVSNAVAAIADSFRGRGLEVGMDLYAPFMAQFVGQDYRILSQHADFIKPMLYRQTFAPAGMGFEYDLLRKAVPGAEGYPEFTMDVDFLDSQLNAMEPYACGKYPGIEINYREKVAPTSPEYVTESLDAVMRHGFDGAVLSWNVMEAPDSHISCLGQR